MGRRCVPRARDARRWLPTGHFGSHWNHAQRRVSDGEARMFAGALNSIQACDLAAEQEIIEILQVPLSEPVRRQLMTACERTGLLQSARCQALSRLAYCPHAWLPCQGRQAGSLAKRIASVGLNTTHCSMGQRTDAGCREVTGLGPGPLHRAIGLGHRTGPQGRQAIICGHCPRQDSQKH